MHSAVLFHNNLQQRELKLVCSMFVPLVEGAERGGGLPFQFMSCNSTLTLHSNGHMLKQLFGVNVMIYL